MGLNSLRIKLADPSIEAAEIDQCVSVLKSKWLVKGRKNTDFERALAQTTNRSYAVAVSSGTMALVAAMKALDIGPDDTVVVPALTFPAPAFAAKFLGANVIAADVDIQTFNVSPQTIAPHIAPSISLVVVVDQFGLPAPTPDIEHMLQHHKIPVLVDAACSLGASLNEIPAGGFGCISTLSFHPRKTITTGEGGAVLTNSRDLATRVRRLVNQGTTKNHFAEIGLNLRLNEMGAAVGIEQLKRLKTFISRRQALAARYHQLPLQFQKAPVFSHSACQTLAALLPEGCTANDRANFIAYLEQHGIEATIASYCLGALPDVARALNLDAVATPNALNIHERGVALPLHPGLDIQDVDEVINVVHDWLNKRFRK